MDLTRLRWMAAMLRYHFLFALSALALGAAALWQAFWRLFVFFAFVAAACGFGAFDRMEGRWHWGVLLFVLAVFFLLFAEGWRRLRLPRRYNIERGMETAGNLPHRPLQTLRDRQAAGGDDAACLWQKHREAQAPALGQVGRARAKTTVPREDRFALRHAAGLLLVVTLAVQGATAAERLTRFFAPAPLPQTAAAPGPSFDIWAEAPAYTGRPAIHIARAGNRLAETVSVPQGSLVKLRLTQGRSRPSLRFDRHKIAVSDLGHGNHAAEFTLDKSGVLRLRQGLFLLGRYRIDSVEDAPPTVTLHDVGAGPNKTIRLAWRGDDDYGIQDAVLRLLPPADFPAVTRMHPTEFPLTPPAPGAQRDALQTHVQDLTWHLLAGERVSLQVVVRDAQGQEAASNVKTLTLPRRDMQDPTAARLVRERARLTYFEDSLFTPILVRSALTSIAQTPGLWRDDWRVFLSLVSALGRISYDGSPEARAAVRDLLWDVALRIEDGGIADATRNLNDALAALAAALNDPDSAPEDIQKHMADIHVRMQDYLRALASAMRQHQDAADGEKPIPPEIADRVMSRIDVDALLQQMHELARGDGRDKLRQMAEMLQNMTRSMDPEAMARAQAQQQQALQDLARMEEIIHRQQEIMEETEALERQQEIPETSEETAQDLARRQEGLKEALSTLAPRLGGGENLDAAGTKMERAASRLEQGAPGAARLQQGEALRHLSAAREKALDRAAAAMQNMMITIGAGPGAAGGTRDPLGRPVNVPERIGLPEEGERSRARTIQQELRRREEDGSRPWEERQYLRRLLDFFR